MIQKNKFSLVDIFVDHHNFVLYSIEINEITMDVLVDMVVVIDYIDFVFMVVQHT